MKTPIEYIIVAVPFHADAATHDELARKVNEKLSAGYELLGAPFLSEEMMYQAMTRTIIQTSPLPDLMKKCAPITTLFVDIGGVLLTNGWDHHARRRAAKHFKLDWAEMEERHGLNFETHEEDKITFNEYLDRVVFYEKRPFTRAEFRRFMFAQSKPYAEMIELVRNLKAKYGLKIIVVSNESRELNAHRIRQVQAGRVCGCFYFLLLRSSPKTGRGYFQAGAGHCPDTRRGRLSISKTRRCSSRSRKAWGFAAFFTRITNPLARNWLRSDWTSQDERKTIHPDHQRRLFEHQVRAV